MANNPSIDSRQLDIPPVPVEAKQFGLYTFLVSLRNVVAGAWDLLIQKISQRHGSDIQANRPPAQVFGALFYSTDLNLGNIDDGANWHQWSLNIIQTNTITLSDAATSLTITFPQPFVDTMYTLTLTPTGFTGSPAAGSSQVVSISKFTTFASVFFAAAPGVGNSVTFDWTAIR